MQNFHVLLGLALLVGCWIDVSTAMEEGDLIVPHPPYGNYHIVSVQFQATSSPDGECVIPMVTRKLVLNRNSSTAVWWSGEAEFRRYMCFAGGKVNLEAKEYFSAWRYYSPIALIPIGIGVMIFENWVRRSIR
jgi:hypothetical protein